MRSAWMAEAACRGMPTAIFYPAPDASADAARAVCARCPVRAECAQHAAENREMHGVWGGRTAAERRNNRPRPDSAARPGPPPLVADRDLAELVESLDPDRPAASQLRARLRVSVPTAYKVLGRARRLGLIEQRGRYLYPRADPEKSGA
jgi:WhiB family transcriptional regulator, redox-sensing transcriptional regulator